MALANGCPRHVRDVAYQQALRRWSRQRRGAERAAGDAAEMVVERLARVGRERGERDHGGEDDVAQFGLDGVPGVGEALAGILAERPDDAP